MSKHINRNIAKSITLETLLEKAAGLSNDPVVTTRARGWFPRIVCEALAFYVQYKQNEGLKGSK